MIALAISAVMLLAACAAVLTIADSLMQARVAYRRLVAEGEAMRAGFAVQAAAAQMRLRPARPVAAVTPLRRPARPVMPQRPACAAA